MSLTVYTVSVHLDYTHDNVPMEPSWQQSFTDHAYASAVYLALQIVISESDEEDMFVQMTEVEAYGQNEPLIVEEFDRAAHVVVRKELNDLDELLDYVRREII